MDDQPAWGVSNAAEALHRQSLVCDFTLPYADIGDPLKKQATLPRYLASGVDCVSLSIGGDGAGIADTMKLLARERTWLLAQPDRYALASGVDDIRQAKADGRLGIVFHFQGTDPLQGSLDMVSAYYELGVRHMLLAYNQRNPVGDGCFEPNDAGLSSFGRKVVQAMNRAGMLVDCSHTGRRTGLDAMSLSESPVIFSHANPAGVHPHPRNIDDDQIQACAETGGVVGILGVSNMLGPDDDASAGLLARHVDYVVQLVGIDHVGISLDFVYDPEATYRWALAAAGGSLPPSYRADMPMVHPEQYPQITDELLHLGYRHEDVAKVLGENWLRVAGRVWRQPSESGSP